jgi:ATP-dependent DNA ligase
MKPLLAHIYEPRRVTYPCYVQPKLNGVRALYQAGHFQSRDEIPFAREVLRHLWEPLKAGFDSSVILDGELYVHGWPLQRVNAAVTPVRQQPTEDTLHVEYHIFDVVDFNQPFSARINIQQLVAHCRNAGAKVALVYTTCVESAEVADSYYAQFVSDGYEGMMYRLGDCPYTTPKQLTIDNNSKFWQGGKGPMFNSRSRFLSDKANRCWHLLKRKDWQDDEFVCFGVVEGEGKYLGTLGALKCHCSNDQTFTVGSGLSDSERDYYWANPPIGRQIKVQYLCLSSLGIPLNPTVLAVL